MGQFFTLTIGMLLTMMMCNTSYAQGSLTPVDVPAPMMKGLDQIEPRIPVSTIPITLTNAGSYYLTTNLYSMMSSGVTIRAGSVTLDLMGFAIDGV